MGGDKWTYGSYLQLNDLLKLQGDERDISSDEMHFIIVHQTFELWFKQILENCQKLEIFSLKNKFLKKKFLEQLKDLVGPQKFSN